MLYHVTWEVSPTVVLDDDKRVREAVGPQLQRLMQSDKVREAGVLTGKRGGFFLVDIESPEDIYELFGPEIYANFKLEVHPVTPLEKIGKILQRWSTEGR
jgi:hypothetical protein